MIALAAAALLVGATAANPPDTTQALAAHACAALAARVDAIPGSGAVWLRSYDADDGRAAPPSERALASAAFSYDNAVAAIALIACDRVPQARRIGSALRSAAAAGQIRNAYRAGASETKPLPNGWWDAAAKAWREDAYQDGSATGNAAWAGLALIQLEAATHERAFGTAAAALAQDLAARTARDDGPGGYAGGTIGFDTAPQRLGWRSTEHNLDVYALATALAARGATWPAVAAHARAFVDAQWDANSGHFWVGTLDDGITPNRDTSALDVQLWAQLVPAASRDWQRALAYVEREHGVPGGFDFNADRDGCWLEGTAQAALVYRRAGRARDAERLLASVAANVAPGGLVYATREPRITTGLAAGTAAVADFWYFRRPHLGATAWAALAATDFDPFVAGGR